MGGRRELIVVSNRGPIGYDTDAGGGRVVKRGAGGLVTALRPLVSHHDVTWIASAVTDEERRVATGGPLEVASGDGSRYRFRLVAHEPRAYDLFYNVVANPTLWFVQHGLWDLKRDPGAGIDAAWDDGYAPVNAAFADAVLEELERRPGAAVFFHDYHLYLAPRLVRERRPDALLSHFIHIPWARPAEWSVLPPRIVRAVHDGLLANDVVGFHTDRWRTAFLETCAALALDTTGAFVTAHPISVDTAEFDALAQSDAVLEREAELVATRPERLILRVDRTDPSKNVVRGIEAFGLLLDRRPDLRGSVGMLALLDASRQTIPEYVEYRTAIEATATAVEARHPAALELRIADDFPGSVAAYKQFDVLLVNAVRDGLNLVAKEAPLVGTRDGVVVLSVNAGAFEELGEWVVPVDPFDLDAHVAALEAALALSPGERRTRAAAIREQVRTNDLAAWSSAQLADLERASTMRP
ncbi:MAG: trehalose-6-phosphate synthase [Actinobacteria bacterium]|nr:trehalose-6-phosphate synthase [Actinomycetota bacterium]